MRGGAAVHAEGMAKTTHPLRGGAELLIARDVGLVIVTLVDALETVVDRVNRFAARAQRGPRTAH